MQVTTQVLSNFGAALADAARRMQALAMSMALTQAMLQGDSRGPGTFHSLAGGGSRADWWNQRKPRRKWKARQKWQRERGIR